MRTPDPTDATRRVVWAITPSRRVHPNDIRPQSLSATELLLELKEWMEDFVAPQVWRQEIWSWENGAYFVSPWEPEDISDEGQVAMDDISDSPDVDYDEQIGTFLRRGNRLWLGPPRMPKLPEMDEEPGSPWTYVGELNDDGTIATNDRTSPNP